MQNPLTQSFSLYLWVPGLDGDAAVRGVPFNVDESVSDTWDTLIDNFKAGFAGHYENSSQLPWTGIIDVMFVSLENTVDTPLGPFTFKPKNAVVEAAATYTVDNSAPNTPHPHRTEVLGGIRYTALKLSLTGPAGNTLNDDHSWFDPFIGGRYTYNFSPHWAGSVRGDVGGFGIGNASDFTWNAIVNIENNLSPQWAIDGGWRWLSYDYQTGSGTSLFRYDVVESGPYLATTYRF